MKYLQYIVTDAQGNTYFDTGIVPNINTKAEISIEQSNLPDDYVPWCCQGYIGSQNKDDSDDTFQIRCLACNPACDGYWFRVGDVQVEYRGQIEGVWHTITLDKDYYTVDGVQSSVGTNYMDTNYYSMYIGAINCPDFANDCYRSCFGVKFGEVKIWDNGTLVFHGKPAEDNGDVGFYDEVSQSFVYNIGGEPAIAGPDASSIIATASKNRIDNTGETISIEVATENAWTVSGNTWLVLSSTGDTSGATITATAPAYSGQTNRVETLYFIDSVTNDVATLNITQKKVQNGQPVYLGDDEIFEMYLGDVAISEAYLGDVLVFSTGPFVGLKVTPDAISFFPNISSASTKVKSSESWEITSLPAWLSASTMSGDSGETIVNFENISQSADTAETITFSSATFSASVSASFANITYTFIEGVRSSNAPNWDLSNCLDTGIYVTDDTDTKIRVKYYGTGVFSDRIVGFDAIECGSDDEDFRYFPTMADAANGRISDLDGLDNSGQYYDITFSNLKVFDNINNNTIADYGVYNGVSTSTTIRIDMSVNWIKEVIIKRLYNNTWNDIADFKAAEDLNGNYGLYDNIGNVWLTKNDLVGTATQPGA